MAVPFVGLTGGLGAGKSTALAALASLGAAVLSTDAVVHELYDEPDVRAAVVERLGERMLDEDGSVGRAAVARAAFADPGERAWLEALLWPRVGDRVAQFRAQVDAAAPPPAAIVVEVPLLFEAGMDELFDATIAVVAPDELRTVRVAARNHAELAAREQRQLGQDEKAGRATHVVVNSGTVEELRQALARVLAELKR